AAVLYGVGARLDHQPELLFLLRKVDHLELVEEAVSRAGEKTATKQKTLAESDVADVFGIELAEPEPAAKPARRKAAKAKADPAAKKAKKAKPAARAGKGKKGKPGRKP